jgi:hypothetical protein
MRALIVYESMYGNTAEIARAIAEGIIAADGEATLRNVDDVMPTEVTDHELLVVGGPTHAHGMSRATTRATAVQDTKNSYEDPTVGDGLRAWLDSLPAGDGRAAAAFDTRIDAPAFLTGAASKGIERQLGHRGYQACLARQSFLVTKENRLVDGEMARARAWGASLRKTKRKAIPA